MDEYYLYLEELGGIIAASNSIQDGEEKNIPIFLLIWIEKSKI